MNQTYWPTLNANINVLMQSFAHIRFQIFTAIYIFVMH